MPDADTEEQIRPPELPAAEHSRAGGGDETNRVADPEALGARDRFGAFSTFYIGLFALLFAYLFTVRVAEYLLDTEFQARVDRAISIASFDRPVRDQIAERIGEAVPASAWVRWGGLRVTTLVLAQDGKTWLYVDGYGELLPPQATQPTEVLGEWMDYLPATANVTATLPHNALVSNLILIGFSSVLLLTAYVSNRRVMRREADRLGEALDSRNTAASRAVEIESELQATRARLSQVEPLEREQSDEIEALQREREALESQLGQLAQKEEGLRGRADRAVELAEEVRALEDLLEEVSSDLESKDAEIDELEQDLKKASRVSGKARSKESDRTARRFRVLYKTIEIDDRAIDDLASLGDEALKLKAEEAIKRLADEADNVSVRRKVGGLPDGIQVFELGFAGKGRIYYAKGKTRRFRVLIIGAKNRQSTDLEYLRRLPKEIFA